jgi:hypothetical protein
MSNQHQLDRFCATRSDDPYWNESAWFSFSIPERGIHGMIYYFFRPNMNLLMGGPILWDESGSHVWDCLYYGWHHIQPMPEGAEKFDFTAHNSLKVEVIEPLRHYRFHYDLDGFALDLDWVAIEEPHHFLGMEIEATGMSAENRMHLEQMGRAKGRIAYKGETYDFDSYALRDTSWGVRMMDNVKRGSYFWAIADDDTAFHAQTMGEGDEQRVVGGFLRLDGRTETVTGGRRLVTQMGPYTPDLFDISLEDEAGRTAEFTCRSSTHLMVNFYPRAQVVWSLLKADFGDGVEGWGDLQEFQPLEMFRKMVRGA